MYANYNLVIFREKDEVEDIYNYLMLNGYHCYRTMGNLPSLFVYDEEIDCVKIILEDRHIHYTIEG